MPTYTTTFTDDFNRADNATPGNGWTVVNGLWPIVSNQLKDNNTSTSAFVAQGSTAANSNDQFAQVTMVTLVASVGVLARITDAANGYYAFRRATGTTMSLYKFPVGGSLATFGTAATYTQVAGDVLRIECEGTTIRGYVNGTLLCTATDSSIDGSAGHGVGIRVGANASGMLFDDFSAGTISSSSGVTVTPPAATGSGLAAPPTVSAAATVTAVAATGSALAPAPAVTAGVVVAVVVGTASALASPPTVSAAAAVAAVVATGSAVSSLPTIAGSASAGAVVATGTGASPAPTTAAGATATAVVATGSGLAPSPTVITASAGTALAAAATGTGQANPPTVAASAVVIAAAATGSGTTTAPTVSVTASVTITAVTATGTGTATDPEVTTQQTVGITVTATVATGTGLGYTATIVLIPIQGSTGDDIGIEVRGPYARAFDVRGPFGKALTVKESWI